MALLLDFNSLFDYVIYLYYLTLKLPNYIWDENISIEEFEDTKGVIRIRKSKKNRQHNDQRKRTNNDLQNIHIKLKIE